MTTQTKNPSAELIGLELPGGWHVDELVVRGPEQSGGSFSQSYRVSRSDGSFGWLKALDIQSAMSKPDWPREVQALLAAFNFERDLLEAARGMDRVVSAVADGSVLSLGQQVYYIIFELAEGGDVRSYLGSGRPSHAWIVRALHQIATGIAQLHSAGIAHQDLKPSNVFLMGRVGAEASAKVGDLGRSSRSGHPIDHDNAFFPGDLRYAPPEFLYGAIPLDWDVRRKAADLYMLGSMLAFVFGGVTMTGSLMSRLAPSLRPPLTVGGTWTGDYAQVLPHVRAAADEAFDSIAQSFPDSLRGELETMLRQLCDPEPSQRGHPAERAGRGNRYSLQRYVSRLDYLAQRLAARP